MTANAEKLSVRIDNSGTKPQLEVEVSIWVYVSDFAIEIEKAEPQGIVPETLLLDVIVTERPSPMKGVLQSQARHFVRFPGWTTVEARISYSGEADGRATHLTAAIPD